MAVAAGAEAPGGTSGAEAGSRAFRARRITCAR